MDTLEFVELTRRFKKQGYKGAFIEMYVRPADQIYYFPLICNACMNQDLDPKEYSPVRDHEGDYSLFCNQCISDNKNKFKEI
jgi:hypothetical protein